MDDCPRIKELLSEYIDGVLDDEARDLVDQHLLVCETCREELESMRSLVEELSSLESVQAPDDFLDQLHGRMEPRSGLRRVLRALFVPPRIKIPLELATALTAAILIFSALIIQHSETEMAVLQHRADGERAAEQVGVTERPIEVALVLEKKSGAAREPEALNEETPWERSGAKGQVVGKMPMAEGGKPSASRAPSAPASAETLPGDRAVSQVRSLIGLAQGRVISSEEGPGGGLPTVLIAEIPSKNYTMFLEGLASMGEFVSPAPVQHSQKQEVLPVRIRILPPANQD